MGNEEAFGSLGIEPRWTSSSKDGVGTAISSHSRIWFTLSHGIVNEVYFPRIDTADLRDHQFLVAGDDFFAEERRDTIHRIHPYKPGVPAFVVENSAKNGRFRITKTVFTDPDADVLVEHVKFLPSGKQSGRMSIYSLMAPHIGNMGNGNTAWIGDYKGVPMMYAMRGSIYMAACIDVPHNRMSCGFSGFSDGWQDISRNRKMTWEFHRADNGNVAITAEVEVPESGEFTFYLGFGNTADEAALKARSTRMKDYRDVLKKFTSQWSSYYAYLGKQYAKDWNNVLDERSITVVKSHQAKDQFPGALIASLSIPWGNSKGDNDIGGYHLIWPRDMVEAAEAQIAVGDIDGAISALRFLLVTQEDDGHWQQNMWLDGGRYWEGIQIDETAFPVLLAHKLWRLEKIDMHNAWPMVRKAAEFLVRSGPCTQEDRWEEDGGYSPFTIAVEVAALLSAAEFAEFNGEADTAAFLRETADSINSNIERWTYATGTDVSRRFGVDGYYVRIAPPDRGMHFASSALLGYVPIKNRPVGQSDVPAEEIVSTDALALVRFGLRSPSDPKILNTIKVVDGILRTDTRSGPVWHRYNYDGYGEHDDGTPFNGTGKGRGWPLLVGERAHYELAAGHREEALKLMAAMEKMTSSGGMLPEQVWDAPDIPERGLFNGKPSGSAMPLVWAHAEYLKLGRSIHDGRIYDMPEVTRLRYLEGGNRSTLSIWAFSNKFTWLEEGRTLRIQLHAMATIHWSGDGWKTIHDQDTDRSCLNEFYTDLPTSGMKAGETVTFTFFWKDIASWEGRDYSVRIVADHGKA
jgi:glucoamylase